MTRFAFIDQEKAHHDVTALCRLLRVSRSGFYAWLGRPASPRQLADEVLTQQIRKAFEDNRQVYGAPRVHAELTDAGVHVGRKRVARLMRAAQIVGCHRRKRSFSITRQDPTAQVAPDRVDRKFFASAPNQLWVADVTYVPTVQGWLYLACVTDVFSRLVIGWSMASHRKTDLVVDAVTMAVHRRGGRVPGVIHHSDRGGEYSSHALERELRRHGALASMGSVADCFDNALAESVFRHPRVRACSTSSRTAGSPHAVRPSSRSSTTSRPSTTPAAGTPPSATSPQPPSRQRTLSPVPPDPQVAATRCPAKRVHSKLVQPSVEGGLPFAVSGSSLVMATSATVRRPSRRSVRFGQPAAGADRAGVAARRALGRGHRAA